MKYLPLIVAILLVLAACAQETTKDSKAKEIADQLKEQATEEQPETTTQPETTSEIVEIEEKPVEQPPAENTTTETKEEVKEEVKEETISTAKPTRMYKFLDKFAKVTGYRFMYKGDRYFVKGTTYKIILNVPRTVKDVSFGDIKKNMFYYDTVYVDRANKNAIAYCEGQTSQLNRQCSQLEIFDLGYPVSFTEYDATLPEDWLFSYLDKEPAFLEENKYHLEGGRIVTLAKFDEIPAVELNIDPATGIVMRADKRKGDILVARYDYEEYAPNVVRDVDVMHRSKSDIPTSETFYK